MFRACVTALVLLGGCGRIGFGTAPVDLDASDAAPDAAAPLGAWGPVTPMPITSIGATPVDDPTLTADRLALIANFNFDQIAMSTRSTTSADWSPMIVDAQLSMGLETEPHMAPDGLTIYFASARGTANRGFEIYTSTRATLNSAWSAPQLVPELTSSVDDLPGTPSADGLLIPVTIGASPRQIHLATRPSTGAAWSAPLLIPLINSTADEAGAHLSADGLALYFYSTRNGGEDLFVTTRTSRAAPFGPPEAITELNTGFEETDPWVSPDQRHIVFASDRGGGSSALYEASR